MSIRSVLLCATLLCCVQVAPVHAQALQAPAPAVTTGSVPAVTPATTTAATAPLPAPRASVLFGAAEPASVSDNNVAAQSEGGSHVIRVSTLVLILGIVILVLLIT